jgi:OOP family OmpA-OmpF porin
LDDKADQAKWRRVEEAEGSVSEFRPRLLLVCLIASLTLLLAFGMRSGFTTEFGLRDVQAWLAPSLDTDEVTPVADTAERPAAFGWSATRIDAGLRLRGSVPSEEDRRTVLGMVKAHFPDLAVEDRLKIAAGSPPQEQWLGAVSFALKQLSHLKRGSARLLNIDLKLDGEARSATEYIEVKKALAGPLPTGLTIMGDSVRPPVADPFVFVADLGANALSLSGSVPSEASRKQLRDLSRRLFEKPGLDDRLQLASGAPKNWDDAVAAALRALSRLESGKIALSGQAVTIEGVAPDKSTAAVVSYQLRRDLPALFSTSESISWKEAAAGRDIAARLIPRIKERAGGEPPTGALLTLPPLLESE